jgi:hypothetical protein
MAACDALRKQAIDALDAGPGTADPSTSCSSDDDCIWLLVSSCTNLCGSNSVISKSELPKVNDAVNASQKLCDEFTAAGCKTIPQRCPELALTGPACVEGACTDFITEKWSSFTVVSNTNSSIDATGSGCGWQGCTVRDFSPDGQVTRSVDNGFPANLKMSAADLTELDGILRSIEFRKGLQNSFGCVTNGPINAPLHLSFERTTDTGGGVGTGDLATCLSAADAATNGVERIWAIAQRY